MASIYSQTSTQNNQSWHDKWQATQKPRRHLNNIFHGDTTDIDTHICITF